MCTFLDTCLCEPQKAKLALRRWILFMLSLQDLQGDNKLVNVIEDGMSSKNMLGKSLVSNSFSLMMKCLRFEFKLDGFKRELRMQ